jgi:hypothetical protein
LTLSEIPFGLTIKSQNIHLPHLVSFELVEVGPHCMDGIAEFLRRHAETLRHVVFDNCQLRRRDIICLRSLKLQLDSIEVIGFERGYLISEDDLRAYVNGDSPSCSTQSGEITELGESVRRRFATDHWVDDGPVYDLAELPEDFYIVPSPEKDDEEDFQHPKARRTMAYWRWDVFDDPAGYDTVYYWQTDEDQQIARTTNWHFKHRDGRTATGDDPLEYFSDWDEESGDEAEPTPFGFQWDEFLTIKTSFTPRTGSPPPGAIPHD